MKYYLKRLLQTMGVRGIGPGAAAVRHLSYAALDAAGSLVFWRTKQPAIDRAGITKILIIRVDRIGDLVLSTPALRAVRGSYPNAEIHLMVSPYTLDIVINNPDIDKVLQYGIDTVATDYDLAIALHPGILPNYLAFRSRARYRIGYTGRGGRFFLTHPVPDDRAERIRHETDSALEMVGIAGCRTDDTVPVVSVTPDGELFAEQYLRQHGITGTDLVIGIHPGSRQPYLRWPKDRYAEVADTLIGSLKARVIFFAGRDELPLVSDIEKLMKEKPLTAHDLTLIQLISLIKKCSLFIAGSTGPLHIAAGLRVPVIGIFGPTHPLDSAQEWAPRGPIHTILSRDTQCAACHPTDCASFACLKAVTVSDVITAVRRQKEGSSWAAQ